MDSLQSGQNILHFRILNKLGQGGMGEVYKAEDLKLGRIVAIKVLPGNRLEDEKARRRFLQEARSASALNHPGIITIHSIEEAEGFDFIVMEYVEGENLASTIQKGPLGLEELIDYGSQIANALSSAHSAGVIHRDIKPANILVLPRGQIKILDFGLAKIVVAQEDLSTKSDVQTGLTADGTILGTVMYMSPEQVRGEPLDERSDIFSLGSLLYEAATGRLPFGKGNVVSILFEITSVEPPAPSALQSNLPVEFDRIVQRAMAKQKDRRYPSAAEIAIDLRSLQSFPTTLAISRLTPVPSKETTTSLVGRQPELNRLESVFRSSLEGSGKLVFITGEPGSGKTALSEQFLQNVQTFYPDVVISRGRCVEQYGNGEAYLPFLDAIGSLLMSRLAEQLASVLRTYAPTWCLQFPAAFSTGAFEKSQQESIGANKERMLREMGDALKAFTTKSPVLLLLEDLHWADPSTIDLLRFLSQSLTGQRLLLLGTFRDEDIELSNHPLKSCRLEMRAHHLVEEIPLGFLDQQNIQDYLDATYSPNTFSSEMSALIHKKTEGHPLFVTSLVQFLVTQQIIRMENEHWTLARPLSEMDLEVPENVRSMIQKKIEALNEADRRVLQYASVEGEDFTSNVVAGLLSMDELELEEQLNHLEKTHRLIVVLGEEELPDGSLATRYRFVHALYQNALYGDLVSKRRVLLHRQVGESLLRHYGGQASRIAAQLGSHFLRGRDFEKAFEYLMMAGDNARKLYAHAEAANLYENSVHQLDELKKRDSADPDKWNVASVRAHESLGDVFAQTGQQENAIQQYNLALKAVALTEVVRQAILRRKKAKALETLRRFPEALDEYEAGEALVSTQKANSIEAGREWIQNQLERMWIHYTRNEPSKIEVLIQNVLPVLDEHGTAAQRARFFSTYVLMAFRRQRYIMSDEIFSLGEKFKEAAEESGNMAEIGHATFVKGFSCLWNKNLVKAEQWLLECLKLADRIGDAVLRSRCLTYLTVVYRRGGDRDRTRDYASQTIKYCESIRMTEYVAATKGNLAWLAFHEGQTEDAVAFAKEALQTWSSLTLVYPFQWLALWPLIAIELQRQDMDEAIEHARGLLHPNQQLLSPDIVQLLEESLADRGKAQESLSAAVSLAEKELML